MDDRIFVLDLLPVKLESSVCNIESTQNSSKVNDTLLEMSNYKGDVLEKKLTIYLADITHTYIALASGTFPLGIGYVASAIKTVMGDRVDIEIFKYASDLDEKLQQGMPDVFMCSNYIWNQNLGLTFAQAIKEKSKDTLIVCGGPNVSQESHKQEAFLRKHVYIDFYVMNEGEHATANMMSHYIASDCDINTLKDKRLSQCITLLPDNSFYQGSPITRIGLKKKKTSLVFPTDNENIEFGTLEDVPSPYLTGMMDKFFDNKLYPLVETNRGCPFSCTFCQQGVGYFNKVAFRHLGVVTDELEFIAKKMVEQSPGITRVEFADPNFAMFKRDLDITTHLAHIQKKYNWPLVIGCSTGKNKAAQVIEAVEKVLPDTLVISSSMQSTNTSTLHEIKRSNIKLDAYKSIQTEIISRGLRSMADVILGLPHETKSSHYDAIFSLIDSGVQEFTSYQAMILKSTELETESSKENYGFVTRWRLLPRGIGKYRVCNKDKIIADVEQIVVATGTLSFDDYLASRSLHLITMIYHNSGVFDICDKIIKQKGLLKSDLIRLVSARMEAGRCLIMPLVQQFIAETESELFETEEECLAFYQREENLKRVELSEIGGNLLWKYLGVSFFQNWHSVVNEMVEALQELLELDNVLCSDLRNYLYSRIIDISKEDINRSVNVELSSNDMLDLLNVKRSASNSTRIVMTANDESFDTLIHYRDVYQNNPNGWSLMLALLRVHSFVRTPV